MNPQLTTGATAMIASPIISSLNGILVQITGMTATNAANWSTLLVVLVGALMHWQVTKDKPAVPQALAAASAGAAAGFARASMLKIMGAIGFIVSAAILLTACATPLPPATIQAVCNGIALSDQSFQQFAKAHPGVIDANGMNVEGGIMSTAGLPIYGSQVMTPAPGSICSPPYVATATVSETTLIALSFEAASLVTTWVK